MSTILNGYEGGSNGTVVNVANSGGTSGTAFDEVTATKPVFSTARAAHGTISALLSNPATSLYYMRWNRSMTKGLARGYFYFTTAPGNNTLIRFAHGADSTSASAYVRSDGKFGLIQGGTDRATSPANFPSGTWVRVELFVQPGDTGTGSARLAYYPLDSTTATWDSGLITGLTIASTTLANVKFGKYDTNAYAGDLSVDDVGLKTDTDAVWGAWPYTAPNSPPTQTPAATAQGCMKLVANASDSDGTIASYLWEITSSPGGTSSLISSTSATAYLLYTTAGSYGIRLTTTDNGGATTVSNITANATGTAAVQHTFIYNAATSSWV